jgi:hypothetical protein
MDGIRDGLQRCYGAAWSGPQFKPSDTSPTAFDASANSARVLRTWSGTAAMPGRHEGF